MYPLNQPPIPLICTIYTVQNIVPVIGIKGTYYVSVANVHNDISAMLGSEWYHVNANPLTL